MNKIILSFIFLLFTATIVNAQSLAINNDGSTANPSSILDVKSTTKGILIPRMSKVEKNAIAAPANGLLIYQNAPDSVGFHFYNGSAWVWLQNSNEGWSLNGNNSITASNFLGTINNMPLIFKVNNLLSGKIDSTNQNTSLGFQALLNTSNNKYNTAIGFDAGKELTSGYGNTILGNKALAKSFDGYENVAIGDSAMGNAISSSSNTAVGYNALKNLDGLGTQSFNTAIGYRSQSYPTATTVGFLADNNTSVGSYAMEKNVSGNRNVAIGRSAMRNVDSSSGNVAIGVGALFQNNGTGFSQNVAIGSFSLNQDLSGIWNAVVGGDAMSNANGSGLNSVVGFRSLKIITGGSENNTLGVGTMEFKDTAFGCVAIGRFALSGNDAGTYLNNKPDTGSVAIGTRAGRYNNANYNTFIGFESGIGVASNTSGLTGAETVSIGAFSLNKLQSGASNSTFGYAALFNNVNGNANIGVGTRSLFSNSSGSNNSSFGYQAGYTNTTQSGNIFLGYQAGYNAKSSDKLYIENSNADSTAALIYGDFAADSLRLNAAVTVRDFTRLGTRTNGAPAIKMKKITIPAGPAVDAVGSYPFGGGITDDKVLGVTVLMQYSAATSKIPPSYRDAAGYEYNIQVQFNGITVINKPGNSANIGGKPITVLITYEE
jgi:trimeric autotransporter adhesin